jgi:transaldolase
VVIGSRRKEDNTTSINIGINVVAQFVWEGKDMNITCVLNATQDEDNVECNCFNINRVIGCVSILSVYISRNRNGDIERLVYI